MDCGLCFSGRLDYLFNFNQLFVLPLFADIIMKIFGGLSSSQPAAIDYKSMVRQFYLKNNPEKLADLDHIMDKYQGKEEDLLRNLERKYGTL